MALVQHFSNVFIYLFSIVFIIYVIELWNKNI